MTSRTKKLLDGAGWAVRCLSLALIPALTTEAGPSNLVAHGSTDKLPNDQQNGAESMPYLSVVAPPALRFREVPVPTSFELEPVPMGPSVPNDPDLPVVVPYQPPVQPDTEAKVKKAKDVLEETKAPIREIPTILPDDTRRDVRPEDVLPFFQFPRGRGTIGVGVQVPSQPPAPTLPPSSATYRQQ